MFPFTQGTLPTDVKGSLHKYGKEGGFNPPAKPQFDWTRKVRGLKRKIRSV